MDFRSLNKSAADTEPKVQSVNSADPDWEQSLSDLSFDSGYMSTYLEPQRKICMSIIEDIIHPSEEAQLQLVYDKLCLESYGMAMDPDFEERPRRSQPIATVDSDPLAYQRDKIMTDLR